MLSKEHTIESMLSSAIGLLSEDVIKEVVNDPMVLCVDGDLSLSCQ